MWMKTNLGFKITKNCPRTIPALVYILVIFILEKKGWGHLGFLATVIFDKMAHLEVFVETNQKMEVDDGRRWEPTIQTITRICVGFT